MGVEGGDGGRDVLLGSLRMVALTTQSLWMMLCSVRLCTQLRREPWLTCCVVSLPPGRTLTSGTTMA